MLCCFSPLLSAETLEQGLKVFKQGNLRQAQKIWEPLAKNGHSSAQFYLSVLFKKTTPRQAERSFYWLNRAAEADYPPAQYNLGSFYLNSNKVFLNKKHHSTVYWWERAAELGFAKAQFNLAKLYWRGDGVEKNLHKAHYWFNKANKQGVPQAKDALVVLNDKIQKSLFVQLVAPKASVNAGQKRDKGRAKAAESLILKSQSKELIKRPERYQKRHAKNHWLMQQPAQNYTIQLYALSSKKNCLKHSASRSINYGLDIHVFFSKHKEEPFCYILHGNFLNKKLAKKEAEDLPSSQQYLIRKISKFHEMNKVNL